MNKERIKKWFYIILGSLSILAGLITIWMPIPIGIPLLLMGLPLLMRYSPNGRKWIIKLAHRYPKLKSLLNRFKWTRISQDE